MFLALAKKEKQAVGKARVLGSAAGVCEGESLPLLHHIEKF